MLGNHEDLSLIPKSMFEKKLDTGTFVYNLPAWVIDQPGPLISELQDSGRPCVKRTKGWTTEK